MMLINHFNNVAFGVNTDLLSQTTAMNLSNNAVHTVIKEFRSRYQYLNIVFMSDFFAIPDYLPEDIVSEALFPPTQSIRQAEVSFQQHFSMNIQICRKQNGKWIKTTNTFFLSLETQNEMGRLSEMQACEL